ncbi:ATP-binding protein, partial [Escherichia coli]|uniref:ATP-binding protein n=1 Tax=Escherichia coli TaxID=562 RepID=UPI0010F77C38
MFDAAKGLKIMIPTLNDEEGDFMRLFMIYKQVMDAEASQIMFEFTYCRFLRPNAVAFLGGTIRSLQHKGVSVFINWLSIPSKIMATLKQNSFCSTLGYGSPMNVGHAIPYREDPKEDVNSILDYLTQNWIGKGWVRVSEPLRDAIAGKVWEIYANSFEHSQSKIGVFSCGQHFKRKNELVLSVVDFGVGIPHKVREYLSSDVRAASLSAEVCLRWACISGNTTATADGIPRGLGLHLLKELVRVNNGKLELYSHDGYVKISSQGEEYKTLPFFFSGTILNIT